MTETLSTEQVEAIVAFAAEIEWLEPRVAMEPRFSAGVSSLAKELLALRKRVGELEASDRPTHRHKGRGTAYAEYVLIGIGRMQAQRWHQRVGEKADTMVAQMPTVDMREVAIYRSVDDGSLWVRPREEFEDGRFEALPTPKESS